MKYSGTSLCWIVRNIVTICDSKICCSFNHFRVEGAILLHHTFKRLNFYEIIYFFFIRTRKSCVSVPVTM